MNLAIAGGLYYERCLAPNSTELFGSGGRAAVALSGLARVSLHTFFPDAFKGDAVANMEAFGIEAHVYPSSDVVEFHYHFPLSPPRFAPVPIPSAEPIEVTAENLIRFGCVEGEIIVRAETAVYDPQSGKNPRPFRQNGSNARRLAVVLNKSELNALSPGSVMAQQVANLEDQPAVVVVKCGPHGAFVFECGDLAGQIPIYKSSSVYKIGSGDIFTAMFSYNWINKGLSAVDAADQASRYVSYYVETRSRQMPAELSDREGWTPRHEPRKVYLAGSFFSTEHLWLVEEVYGALRSLGIDVFSPYHEIGVGTGAAIAEADLRGLEDCAVVFALLSDRDPGTIFELGYAICQGKKVIAYCENSGPQDLTMILGTGCEVVNDLATALYRVAWASME
jgi:hypothetical protein